MISEHRALPVRWPDLLMLKVQQKIMGSFWPETGSAAFARIRGCCATRRNHSVGLLAALQTVFTGQPSMQLWTELSPATERRHAKRCVGHCVPHASRDTNLEQDGDAAHTRE